MKRGWRERRQDARLRWLAAFYQRNYGVEPETVMRGKRVIAVRPPLVAIDAARRELRRQGKDDNEADARELVAAHARLCLERELL